ncbi:uncharacterized protein LOC106672345 isoform X2 [Cimex lectularius]|uniref:F-box domain-containing protein n=1 Tax=Cimex lectularius TaxID=79782 RepID=A0A8I6TH50_CIMLE|nr:uncharacterized protein LOC106672345 isoform X2 [Cimex lectularius]
MEILLPEEIVVKIGLYLDAKDVLSSCLVSKFWRNALNNNKIWFNLCRKEFWLEKMENPILDVRSCRFYPAFSHPVNDCDQLSDICPWRVRFMQEMRISRNWKNGKFREQPMREAEAQELERISKVDMLCGEDFIIAPYQMNNTHKFRIWEFKNDIFETVPIVCSHRFENVDFFNLTDCGFIYVQSNLLVYYVKKENCIFTRQLRVLITEEPTASKNIPDDEDITNWET